MLHAQWFQGSLWPTIWTDATCVTAAVGRISFILSNRRSVAASGRLFSFARTYEYCLNWASFNQQSSQFCGTHAVWRHLRFWSWFFSLLTLFLLNSSGSEVRLSRTALGWNEAREQTWSPPRQKLCRISSSSVQGNIFSSTGGYGSSSRGFFLFFFLKKSNLITCLGMVAAAQLLATPERSAFFACWLVIDRDADCSSLPTWFSWRFVPRSCCKCWERGPGPCWFFPRRFLPRFHLFEEMRKYLFIFPFSSC